SGVGLSNPPTAAPAVTVTPVSNATTPRRPSGGTAATPAPAGNALSTVTGDAHVPFIVVEAAPPQRSVPPAPAPHPPPRPARPAPRKPARAGPAAPRLERLEDRLAPALITVTTTSDDLTPNDGSVSLREAITAINAGNDLGDPDILAQNPGTFGTNDTIRFNIP